MLTYCSDATIEADEIPALIRDVLIAGSDTVAAAAAVTLMEIGRMDRSSALHEQLASEIQALKAELHPTYSQVHGSNNL
jgi:phosphosulfolactate synthase (CoM biosynthesis protein A)